jgi:hypothetical protein
MTNIKRSATYHGKRYAEQLNEAVGVFDLQACARMKVKSLLRSKGVNNLLPAAKLEYERTFMKAFSEALWSAQEANEVHD